MSDELVNTDNYKHLKDVFERAKSKGFDIGIYDFIISEGDNSNPLSFNTWNSLIAND